MLEAETVKGQARFTQKLVQSVASWADSRQGLGRGIDRWGNSPVLLSPYNGFVLLACVQPGELISPGSLGVFIQMPQGGGSP